MDWISLAHDKASSQHGKIPSVSIYSVVFHSWVIDYYLFKKDSIRGTELIKKNEFNFGGY
jgi:hypothetical protein